LRFNGRKCIAGSILCMALGFCIFAAAVFAAQSKTRNADGYTNRMPIGWDEAFFTVIASPEDSRLEAGEILSEIKKIDTDTVVAQSMGRIKAQPQECYQLVRNYDQYIRLMPHTVESKVIRSFSLENSDPGEEAVDFWTRIRVFGFSTGYLLRIAHLAEPDNTAFGTYWTLVDDPAQTTGCMDAQDQPCQNDLAINVGSHRFEPFPGHPEFTLHTYTLIIEGTRWYQRAAFRLGARQSMADVILGIRAALNCAE